MRRVTFDGRDQVSVAVSVQEAQAVERCLKLEAGVSPGTMQRVRVVHFDRRVPRTLAGVRMNEHALEVYVMERSSAPDRVTLHMNRVLSDETRQFELELPRRALRPALRRNALEVLIPGAPDDLVPVLGIECTRRRWRHAHGWSVTLDRDLAFHRVDPRILERTGQIPLGVPDRFADGRVLLTLKLSGAVLPAWLENVVSTAQPWNVVEDGYTLVQPKPSAKPTARELRLVHH